ANPLSESAQGHQREVMGIHVVAQVEVIGKTGAGGFGLIPRARLVLPFEQPIHAAREVVADLILTREQTDQGPRGLAGGAVTASAPGAIFMGETAFTPSAVGVLMFLEPRDRAPNPGFVDLDPDRPQPRERRESAVNVIDPPPSPPRTVGFLLALEPFDRA